MQHGGPFRLLLPSIDPRQARPPIINSCADRGWGGQGVAASTALTTPFGEALSVSALA